MIHPELGVRYRCLSNVQIRFRFWDDRWLSKVPRRHCSRTSSSVAPVDIALKTRAASSINAPFELLRALYGPVSRIVTLFVMSADVSSGAATTINVLLDSRVGGFLQTLPARLPCGNHVLNALTDIIADAGRRAWRDLKRRPSYGTTARPSRCARQSSSLYNLNK